jgi:uncharacterized membrane-anchored protein
MTTQKKLFIAVVALQVISLLGMIAYKYRTVLTGDVVVLETVPVDPRDLLRGDYVQLRFKITSVPSRFCSGECPKAGSDAYVTLEKEIQSWDAVKVSKKSPKTKSGQVTIRGKVKSDKGNIQVDYKINSYYVPEGQGRKHERIKYWEVYVDRSGNPVIKGPAGL